MNARQSAQRFIRRWFAKEFINDNCNPNQSRQTSFGPQIGLTTFTVPLTTFAPTADLDSGILLFPARFLWLASLGPQLAATATVTLFVHFQPFGHQYTAADSPLSGSQRGNEAWFMALGGNGQQAPNNWSMRVAPGKEFNRFYLDGLMANGAADATVSFGYSNDIEYVGMTVINT